MDILAEHDALALADLVRRGEASSRELVDAAIARIEALNPKLNAVVHTMYEEARATSKGELPDGPFSGVPLLLKDLVATVRGVPTTGSNPALAGIPAAHDSELVRRYRAAGFVFIGRTNTPEFGLLGTTEPVFRGPTRNPWNPEHSPGGSSGGSGAAVAARMVPIGHGGDGGGSIRIPASACGIFGLKPTRGRNPLGPDVNEGWGGFTQEHALTVSVRDSAALLDASSGPAPGDPYWAPPPARPFLEEVGADPGHLRIAFTREALYGRSTDPSCAAAVDDAAKLCESLGHTLEEAQPQLNTDALIMAYLTTVAAGAARSIEKVEETVGRRLRADEAELTTWFMAKIGRSFSALDLQRARDTILVESRKLASFFEQYDLLLTATMAHPPIRLGELALGAAERAGIRALNAAGPAPALRKVLEGLAPGFLDRTPNTQLFNQSGQPAMSVPLYWSEAGLPIGVQFAARFGDEATLFRLAAQLEEARPWAGRKPPIAYGS
jgi:amidase